MLRHRLHAAWQALKAHSLPGAIEESLHRLPIRWLVKRRIPQVAAAAVAGVSMEIFIRLAAFLFGKQFVFPIGVFAAIFFAVALYEQLRKHDSGRFTEPQPRRWRRPWRRPQKGTPLEPTGKELFAAIAPGLDLRRGREPDAPGEIDWIPIVRFVPDEAGMVGLAAEGYWLVEGKNGLRVIDRREAYLFLFPMMERPMQDIVAEIRANPALEGCADRIVDAFPFIDIIRAAFRGVGSNWIEYAFAWFADLPLSARTTLSDELEVLCAGRGSGQKLRHRAEKELARICRESGK